MVALYAVTVFVGASLLFLIQPLFARMVLPLLGGSPAVWNTAMVFYQSVLLAAYGYAHVSTTRLGIRRQAGWHLVLLAAPLAFLPVAIPAGWPPPPSDAPLPWLLGLMAVAVGLPFFAIAATSPLLQRWFAGTGDRQAADPYFLYVASNAGSMLALLSYPIWIEPRSRLAEQSRWWMWAYGLLFGLTAVCAVCLWRSRPAAAAAPAPSPAAPLPAGRPSAGRRLRWVWLAFVPSSLLLSVTTYLSSDVAVVPLMWIVPLAIYLLTFVLAFARRPLLPRVWLERALPLLLAPLVMTLNMKPSQPMGVLMLLHLATFFVGATLCHTDLAAGRPATAHLTEYYLWMSVGGALGGLFNALVAPLIFRSVAEYPLMLVLLCLVNFRAGGRPWNRLMGDLLWPALLVLGTTGAVLAVHASRFRSDLLVGGLLFAVPTLVCFLFSRRPLRFALGLAGLLLIGGLYENEKGQILFARRTFFGMHRVMIDADRRYHVLYHGRILHGIQSLDPGRRDEPLTYYARTGPVGDVLAAYGRGPGERIGVVGLGAGTLASYARPGQRWSYFEIDPTVLALARDPRFFTFLRDAAVPVRVVLGDARLSLSGEPDGGFDLLIMDAYSSDAIPVHLVTQEALALYLHKLAPGGRLAFHISNTHLDLEPVLANLARAAGLTALTRADTAVEESELRLGKAASVWLVMARRADDLALLAANPRWHPSRARAGAIWTDDYSSVLSILRWQ